MHRKKEKQKNYGATVLYETSYDWQISEVNGHIGTTVNNYLVQPKNAEQHLYTSLHINCNTTLKWLNSFLCTTCSSGVAPTHHIHGHPDYSSRRRQCLTPPPVISGKKTEAAADIFFYLIKFERIGKIIACPNKSDSAATVRWSV